MVTISTELSSVVFAWSLNVLIAANNNAQVMPQNLSPFCASLRGKPVWRFCRSDQFVTPEPQEYFSRKGAKAQSAAAFPRFSLRLCAFARERSLGMVVANCHAGLIKF